MGMIDRKLEIAQKIQQQGRVNVAALAQEYGVSTMTIRRDLARLEQEGLVTVEYGGAILRQHSLLESDMHQKQTKFLAEKQRIAKAALDFVREGSSIFLDAGTTTCEIARLLNEKKNLRITTNSLLAANVLAANGANQWAMCPGEYRAMSMAFLGQTTDEFLKAFRFDVLFLGVEGVTPGGVYVPDEKDGITKKNLIRQSGTVVCVADSSKIGQAFHYRIAELEQVAHLITDRNLEEKWVEPIQSRTDLILV